VTEYEQLLQVCAIEYAFGRSLFLNGGVDELDIDDDGDMDDSEDDHKMVAQRLLWLVTLPPSCPLPVRARC
jgi:hypothetical protein